ncbi:LysR family transcriptional regulator [Neptunicoccus sediminis]|uniref:LysR family transcriptional regulator n=1 Tax=Neptunicoccus sediminis TaxID=1892596 RepID=UPI00084627FD|nr:LysR family transcriptional regulator [Neptunicoccus sediminis]
MDRDNWDDYRFILAVAEHGSLNAAARVLGVNHATVLRRVIGFQDRHGIRIFDRARNGYRLRADQGGLIAALSDVRRAMDSADRAVTGQGAGVRGPVRITSTDSFCATILPEMIAGLQATHPELKLDLLSSNQPLNFEQLDAEVTVRPADKLPEGLSGTEVARLGFAVYANETLQFDPASPPWLALSGPLLRSRAGKWQQSQIEESTIVGAADSFITLRGLCSAGLGLALLPCFLGDGHDALQRVAGYPRQMETGIWVANHRDLDAVPRILACRMYLGEEIKRQSALLRGWR